MGNCLPAEVGKISSFSFYFSLIFRIFAAYYLFYAS